jgi:hypothetical protein
MAEFKVWSNAAGDRLYIKIGGFFKESDVGPAIDGLRAQLDTMQPEFDVVTDYSKFMPGSPKAVEGLKAGAEMVKNRGRRRAIRVSGALVTGLLQFKRVVGSVFSEDEHVRYASSIAEADAILDNWQ